MHFKVAYLPACSVCLIGFFDVNRGAATPFPSSASDLKEASCGSYDFTEDCDSQVIAAMSRSCCSKISKKKFMQLVESKLSSYLSMDCILGFEFHLSIEDINQVAKQDSALAYCMTKNYSHEVLKDFSRFGPEAREPKAMYVEFARKAYYLPDDTHGLDWRALNALNDVRFFCRLSETPSVVPPELAQIQQKITKAAEKGKNEATKEAVEEEPQPPKEVLFEDKDCMLDENFLLEMARNTMDDNGKRCGQLHSYHSASPKKRDKYHFFDYSNDPFLIKEITYDCYTNLVTQNKIDLLISHPKIILELHPKIITESINRPELYKFFGNVFKAGGETTGERLHLYDEFLKVVESQELKFGGDLMHDVKKSNVKLVPTDEDMLFIVEKHPVLYTVTMARLLKDDEARFFVKAQDLRDQGLLPKSAPKALVLEPDEDKSKVKEGHTATVMPEEPTDESSKKSKIGSSSTWSFVALPVLIIFL